VVKEASEVQDEVFMYETHQLTAHGLGKPSWNLRTGISWLSTPCDGRSSSVSFKSPPYPELVAGSTSFSRRTATRVSTALHHGSFMLPQLTHA
jgi:hypothetical protein